VTPGGGAWHLGLDTATPWLALALWRPSDGTLHRHRSELGRGLASALMGELDAFLRTHGVRPGDLAAVGVGVGPGSFTGVRIGVAAALGLGRGLAIPVGGVGTLDAIALAGLAEGEEGWALLDARKGAVYAGRFRRTPDTILVLEEVRRRPRADIDAAAIVIEGVPPDASLAARAARAGGAARPRYG
jgi:tRNA threonylcarbamoyladenosine biosynthesis protein TsaB